MKLILGLLTFLGMALPAASMGYTCAEMEAVCTQDGVMFPAQSGQSLAAEDTGNDFGCLLSQPNPSWYYFEIATAGPLNMDLSASQDIDYIIWGPYADLATAQGKCGNLDEKISCSFSTTNMEMPVIPNAQVGQVYVLLITNYADTMQDIALTHTSGTGMTDCTIVTDPPAPSPTDAPGPEVEGDPHFMTWNGTWYDFMGECDLVLLDAPEFDDVDALRVEVRTTGRYQYSYVETVAVKIGDEIVEVSSYGTYFLNGVEGADLPGLMAGKYTITHEQPEEKKHFFNINLGDDEAIVITTFKDLVSVKLDKLHDKRFVGSRGMLGDYNTGKTMARDGTTELADGDLMAAEWQVRPQEDGHFFQTVRVPQYPEACKPPKTVNVRGSGNMIEMATAEKACGHFTGFQKEACVHDVMATGDSDLAATF